MTCRSDYSHAFSMNYSPLKRRASRITMIVALLLTCAISTAIGGELQVLKISPKCDGLEVRGVFHRNHVIAKGLNRPYQLSYHKKTHDIYFSNNVGNDTEDKFEIRRVDRNSTETTLHEIHNGFATAIDEESQVGYFGGSGGIYKMNFDDGKITKIIEKHDVWDMFFKKHLYFITYPQQRLYKYTDDHKSKHNKEKHPVVIHEDWIHEKIYQFAIDGDDDVFITNETGLFMIKRGSEHRTQIHGEKVFRAIEINHKGEAHFCGKNGIHVAIKHEHELHEIAHVKNIFGLTFDNDGHIVYSDPLKIVKLVPSQCKIVGDVVSYLPVKIPN